MKKFIAAAMALCLVLALTACSKKNVTENILTGYKTGDVTLGEYKGLTYTPASVEVTEEDIDTELENLRNNHVDINEITDRTDVQTGDIANINYVGTKDGVAFEGGTAENYSLKIGSGQFIPGFEDGLIGRNVGETVVLDLTFPETYGNASLAGQAVQFEVTINKISIISLPELTDEFIAANTDCATIAEYREEAAANLKAQRESDAASDKDYQIVQAAINNATFNTDLTEEIEKSKNDMITQYDNTYKNIYGYDAATLYYYMYGMDQATFEKYMYQSAEMNTKYAFVVSAIAEKEGFTASDEEVEELAKKMLSTYGYNIVDELYDLLRETYNMDGRLVVAEQVKLNKAAALLSDSAVAAE